MLGTKRQANFCCNLLAVAPPNPLSGVVGHAIDRCIIGTLILKVVNKMAKIVSTSVERKKKGRRKALSLSLSLSLGQCCENFKLQVEYLGAIDGSSTAFQKFSIFIVCVCLFCFVTPAHAA